LKNKSYPYSKLIRSLDENIRDPFIVLSPNGNILEINKKAEKLFLLEGEKKNIFDILSEESSMVFNSLLEEILERENTTGENLILTLKNGFELRANTLLTAYSEGSEQIIFCTFASAENEIKSEGITQIKTSSADPLKFINDEESLKITDEIKKLYPFTVLGKEKVKFLLNNIKYPFWLKDSDGKYLVINSSASKHLGIKISQMEGKKESEFLPKFLVDLKMSVEKYIKESNNAVVIKGIPFGMLKAGDIEIIELPLIDSNENVIAIVGFTQETNRNLAADIEPGSKISVKLFYENFPKPIVLIDEDGRIKYSSRQFCDMFEINHETIGNSFQHDLLPPEISDQITKFLRSGGSSDEFILGGKYSRSRYKILVNRIEVMETDLEYISIYFEEIISHDNLETLINTRGRMFDLLIQNNPEPIFIYDRENLGFLDVNNAALALYGYKRDEFLKMDLTDLYSQEDIQTLLDSSNINFKEGTFNGPFKHKKKDGSIVFVEMSKIAFRFNEQDALFNIIKDVSDKLELQKANQFFKSAHQNTNELIIITDSTGFISFVNARVNEILGFKESDLLNSSFTALVLDEDRRNINTSIFQSGLTKNVHLTAGIKNNLGESVQVELTAVPILNYKNDIENFNLILKPIEEEKTQEAVDEETAENRREVIEPSPEPKTSIFLSSIFHEILTPINVILGFMQEFTDNKETLTEEQKEAVDIIDQNRKRLLSSMNSIVEYSNIERNKTDLSIDELSITEIIDSLHKEADNNPALKGYELAYGRISSSLNFITDKEKFLSLTALLMKIIAPLLDEKKMFFSSYQFDDDSFIISLKDNYSVSSSSLIRKLSSLFDSDDSAAAKDYGISRLSLQLSKSLIKLLQGRFEIIDKQREKSDYGFVFPLKLTSQDAVKPEEPKSSFEEVKKERAEKDSETSRINVTSVEESFENNIAENKNLFDALEEELKERELQNELIDDDQDKEIQMEPAHLKCLYIEDQVDSQILFKVQMKDLKEIKFAVSFEEALPLLDNYKFDFIVMDINLQGEYNGLDALKIIHKMPGFEKIPIIAVTAYVLPGDKEKFIAAGFDDFISKPIFREKMLDSLEKIFSMQT
jgi:PAS domain S-box-containing protein